MTARLAPDCEAISTARFTAPAWPEITVCSGEFKFAGETTSPSAAFLQISATSDGESPRIAAIAPSPAGTASCMYCPRCRDQLHGVGKRERSRGHESRIFAEAVSGSQIGRHAMLFERAIRRHGNRQNRGLRVCGQLELVFRTFKAEFRKRKSKRGVGLFEDRMRFGEIRVEVAAHARDTARPGRERGKRSCS